MSVAVTGRKPTIGPQPSKRRKRVTDEVLRKLYEVLQPLTCGANLPPGRSASEPQNPPDGIVPL